MGDVEVDSKLPGSASDEENGGTEGQKSGDAEKNGKSNDGSAENKDTVSPTSDDVALAGDATAELNHAEEDNTGAQLTADGGGGDEPGTAQATAENGSEEGVIEGGKRKRSESSVEGAECVGDDDLYCSVRGSALAAINAVRRS